jgi:lipoprotein-anchoring transpeptidase ErfK/SrfK
MKLRIIWALLAVTLAGCGRMPNPPATDAKPMAHTPAATNAPVATALPIPAPPIDDRLPQALTLEKEGKIPEARALLQDLAAVSNATDEALSALGELNTTILFTQAPAPEKIDYTIQSGDTLGKLAAHYGTTIELIQKANNITGEKIRIGDRLRIYQGKFAVDINNTVDTLTVTDDGRFFKRYRVGTGQYGKTPLGEFKISTRLKDPAWHRPDGKIIPFGDPENILGTHWLGLDIPRYGIHGTWETNSIGKQASAGCVRLLNDDVAELYVMLPLNTPVTIHN